MANEEVPWGVDKGVHCSKQIYGAREEKCVSAFQWKINFPSRLFIHFKDIRRRRRQLGNDDTAPLNPHHSICSICVHLQQLTFAQLLQQFAQNIWQQFEPILVNFWCYWAKVNCCNWTNNHY